MNINGRNYELKKIKTWTGNEGHGLEAELWQDGKRVCSVLDDASGCETGFRWGRPPATPYFPKSDIREEIDAIHAVNDALEADVCAHLSALPKALLLDWEELEAGLEAGPYHDARLFSMRLEQLVDMLFNEWQNQKTWKRHAKTKTLFKTITSENGSWQELNRPLNAGAVAWLKAHHPLCEVFCAGKWTPLAEVLVS